MPTLEILLISVLFFAFSGVLYFFERRKIRLADKLTLFIAPFLLVLVSLSVATRKVGGTIMTDMRGWPHSIASYQLKDVLDGTLIQEWHLTLGSLGAYFIADYLFYLSIVLGCFFIIRRWQKSDTKAAIGLRVVLAVVAAGLFSSQTIKEGHIKREISKANYCETEADCSDAGSQCPFDCYAYVNRQEAGRISGLISSFRSTCVYSCLACPTVACEEHRCKPVCDNWDH